MRLRRAAHSFSGPLFIAILFASLFVSLPLIPRAAGKPLSQKDILDLLQGSVPNGRVSSAIDEHGINFSSSSSFEQRVRNAGGSSEVIDSLRRASQRYEEVSRPQTGSLVVRSTPGETEVYLNDELKGMTSPEGELRIPDLQPGDFKLRVSSLGYKSFEQSVSVTAGDDQTVYVTLLQRSTPSTNLPPPIQNPGPSTNALPIPGMQVDGVQFFEGPHEKTLDKNDRVYRTTFDKQSARSIYWEIDFHYPEPGRRIDFTLDAYWYGPNGNQFHHQTLDASAQADWNKSWPAFGFGWVDGGHWQPGVYRVEISYQGTRLTTGTFQIYDGGQLRR